MINNSDQIFYRLDNLNAEQRRISYQMSTKKLLENGSDDSVLYSREIYVEDKLRVYDGLKTQISKTTAQNNVSDSTIGEIKKLLEKVKTELIKANTDTTTEEGRKAIAVSIAGIKENIFDLVNTQVEGEYVFSGSDSSKAAFTKDANGKVSYVGDNQLRKVLVEEGSYRERGINGFDMMMYATSTATKGQTLTFSDDSRIVDQDGNEWQMHKKVQAGDNLQFGSHPLVDGNGQTWTLNPGIPQLEDGSGGTIPATVSGSGHIVTVPPGINGLGYNQLRRYEENGNIISGIGLNVSGTSPNQTAVVPNTDGTKFEAKANIFDALDNVVNALNKVDNLGNPITEAQAKAGIATGVDEIKKAYDAVNVAHAELGGKNKIFEISLERVSAKYTQFDILLSEVSGVNLAKVAAESKALELTYTSLYATIQRTSELSLTNFLR